MSACKLYYKTAITFAIIVFSSLKSFGQYNTEVEAKIQVSQNDEHVTINGTAFNKTEISQSLIYKLTVFKTDTEGNKSKNEQSGRFILNSNEKKELSTVAVNTTSKTRTIILLLIYNLDDKIIGKDRIVLNDSKDDLQVKKEIIAKVNAEKEKEDIDTRNRDGIELKGIVVEETKTKPGRDFYKLFYDLYSRNSINGNKVVTVKEILAIGRNTKIEVLVGDVKVFTFFVRPSTDYLTKMNDYAIIKVYKHFKNSEKESKIIKRY